MSDQLEEPEVEDIVDEDAENQEPAEIEETDEAETEGSEDEECEDEGDLVIQLDEPDEDAGDDETPVIRTMREKLKEKERRIKELEKSVPKQEAPKLGPKPTLEDHDYDTDAYDAALLAWNEQKRQAEAEAQKAKDAAAEREKAYSARFEAYTEKKAALGVKDFEDAEDLVRDTLSPVQQSMIVDLSDDAALTVYALGKNPKHLAELAATEPHRFAYQLAKLESKMKPTTKRKPSPEKRITGGAAVPATGGKELDRLRAEAEKTGDYSKVTAYKRRLRSQA